MFHGSFVLRTCRSILTVAVVLVAGCRLDLQTKPKSETATVPDSAPVVAGVHAVRRSDDEDPDPVSPEAGCVRWGGRRDMETFRGCSRRAAKTTWLDVDYRVFDSVVDLRAHLTSDADMPEIPGTPNSIRVRQERLNVTVPAELFAASREEDRDYHLIIGDPGCQSAQCFLNVEISGLPESLHERAYLSGPRAQFEIFMGESLPGTRYDHYEPPIPVVVSGSVFFDTAHRNGGVGPRCCRSGTAWEIHPITEIQFIP